MSRHSKQIDDHISIAYGYDHTLHGYFLQVYDNRLEWESTKSDEENAKAEEIDPSGCGEIESYATNNMLLSKQVVNRSRFVELLEKYGVNKKHCTEVALDQPISD